MPDALDRLRDALREAPVHPLPAAEVRRLGDRRRRRTAALVTAGVALVVAAVVVPLSLGGSDDRGSVGPATRSPSPTPAAVLTAIPAGFPLDLGWDDSLQGAVFEPEEAADLPQVTLGTGVVALDEGATDLLLAATGAGGDAGERRWLMLFPDARTASSVVDRVRAGVDAPGDDVVLLKAPVGVPAAMRDEATAIAFGGTTADGGYADVLYRAGNALLLASRSEVGPGVDGGRLQDLAGTVGSGSRELFTGRMCAFTAVGC